MTPEMIQLVKDIAVAVVSQDVTTNPSETAKCICAHVTAIFGRISYLTANTPNGQARQEALQHNEARDACFMVSPKPPPAGSVVVQIGAPVDIPQAEIKWESRNFDVFGARIRRERTALKMTQKEFAELVSGELHTCRQADISAWECCLRRPMERWGKDIAKALSLSVDEMFCK